MKIPANVHTHHWRSPSGDVGSFRPNGPVLIVGNEEALHNPREWTSKKPMLAARMFVGFNVGSKPTWDVDDLVPIVEKMRKSQGHAPDSSFLIQKGIYTSIKGKTIRENGAQVIVLNLEGTPKKEFVDEMEAIAEQIAKKLKQERVIVDIQKNGVTTETFSVLP